MLYMGNGLAGAHKTSLPKLKNRLEKAAWRLFPIFLGVFWAVSSACIQKLIRQWFVTYILCCVRALVPGVFVFPSRGIIVPCSTASFEGCMYVVVLIHNLCLSCPRLLSLFFRRGADPPHTMGNERRRLLASVRKITSAGASSSCTNKRCLAAQRRQA